MNETIEQIARALFENIEAGSIEGVAAIYADDIQVWHNFSNAVQSKAENLYTLKSLVDSVATIRYQVEECRIIDSERVVQRHQLECTTRSGDRFTIPACIFITARAGKIVRIDEYLDSAQANGLRIATGRERFAGRSGRSDSD